MDEQGARAASASAVLGAERAHTELLQSIVAVARQIFAAGAASIFLYDEATDELVFEALTGPGADTLVGQRFPSSVGIAGWVLVTRQPLILDDVGRDPRFARSLAESTGYVPTSVMAAPLLFDERCLGVLEVLDRPRDVAFDLDQMELLCLFAHQAALAVDLLQHGRRARAALAGDDALDVLARLAGALEHGTPAAQAAAVTAVRAIVELLERTP